MNLLLAGSITLLYGQEPKPEQLQEMVQLAIAKAYHSSVYLADYDTIAKVTTGSRFSGVVVSKDGIILTAAHVGRPGKVYQVIFADGKQRIAIGLGRIQQLDAAVLKINKPGEWPFAEMGWSSSLKLNEPCISIACPGSFTPQKTVIRFGYVADLLENRRKMIRTTCLMEPGDSGGPVFDLYGRVIGIHSSITLGLESNFEIPVDVFRKYWSALMKAEDYTALPSEDPIVEDPLKEQRTSFSKLNSVELMLAEKESQFDDVTVSLFSLPDSGKAVGSIVKLNSGNKSDKTYIISKSSLLPGEITAILANGRAEQLTVCYRDDRKDLVLLEMDRKSKNGIDISAATKNTFSFADMGKILISPNPLDEGEISILGTLEFDMPGLYSSGYLGSALEVKGSRALISMVQEKSPAHEAGLKIGDEVLRINKSAISSSEQFVKEIQKNKPRDTIHIEYKRDGVENSIDITLAKRPYNITGHVAERFTDGKSDRRDGFKNAFVHDGKLKPAEVGGPIFDIKGNFIGINMARYSRTSSIAVSAIEVVDFLRPQMAKAQKIDISKVEKENKSAIAKAYAASVRIWGFDTLKKVQTSSQFSGVVVDKAGIILTVSHAIQPNRTYKVRFPDGREAIALALGKMGFPEMQTRPDLGMMILITKDDWPVAEMGWSYSLKVDQNCISISYPETLNQLLPTVRFGKINKIMNEWGFIESSCKMEPGDSGGPLFDGYGRVIGMHSRCEKQEDDNYEVPVDLYREYWTALKNAENYKALPGHTDDIGKDPLSASIMADPMLKELPAAFSSISRMNGNMLVLTSTKDGQVQQAYGTLFEHKGETFLVSKSSIVGDDVSLGANRENLKVKILARDKQNDLVLLSTPVKIGKPIALGTLNLTTSLTREDLGTFLLSPTASGVRISVVSSMLFNLPKKFSSGFIGAAANFTDGKAKISGVAPGSPAAAANLQQADEILDINGVSVTGADVYNNEMQKSLPGDTLMITLSRNGKSKMLKLVAGQRPPSTHAADQFEGGKSIRLDGFKNIFAHDAIIKPNECGGPVFDSNGKFYGLNIARFSRTSTIVMPVQQIGQLIEQFKREL